MFDPGAEGQLDGRRNRSGAKRTPMSVVQLHCSMAAVPMSPVLAPRLAQHFGRFQLSSLMRKVALLYTLRSAFKLSARSPGFHARQR